MPRMNAKRVSTVLVALALISLAVACTGRNPELTATSTGRQPVTESYRIGPGDRLRVFVWANPGLSDEVPVRPDGRISTPLLEDVVAANKTPAELAREIEQKLGTYVEDPLVTVIVTDFVGPLTQQVRVVGEATQPQAIPFRDDMTMLDVMIAVGRTAAGREEEYRVRLDDLVRDGDISANVAMRPGDVVIIPESYF
jgi:polysaccharide export outer membrane protein